MSWRLEYSNKARKQLGKMDEHQRNAIVRWMHKNIDGCANPRAHGRALVGDKAGYWRYRVGKYRVICELHDERLVVIALEVGHRGSVYR